MTDSFWIACICIFYSCKVCILIKSYEGYLKCIKYNHLQNAVRNKKLPKTGIKQKWLLERTFYILSDIVHLKLNIMKIPCIKTDKNVPTHSAFQEIPIKTLPYSTPTLLIHHSITPTTKPIPVVQSTQQYTAVSHPR